MTSLRNTNIVDAFAFAIIAIGVILRFYGFYDWSLTNDELSTLIRSQYSSVSEVIQKGVAPDVHPAFVEVFVHYWGKIFGYSAFFHRLPFVLFSSGALLYFYLFSKKFINRNAALIALSLFTVSQLFVQYAQIARAYSVGLFFILAFAYYWSKVVSNKASIANKIAFAVFGALCFYTHYFAGLAVLILLLLGLFQLSKKQIINYLVLSFGIGILFLPHLNITLNHIKKGGVGWLPEPEPGFFLDFLNFLLNDSFLLPSALILLILTLLVSKSLKWNKQFIALLFLFAVPYLIGYYYSIYRSPVLQFSVLIFFTPFLVLLYSSLVKKEASLKLISFCCLFILSVGAYSLIFQRDFYGKKPFANFKAVAELSLEWTEKLGNENVITISNVNSKRYLKHYIQPIDSTFAFDVPIFDQLEVIKQARDLIQNSEKEYVLISFANVPVPAEVHEFTKQIYPEVIFQKRFFNSEVIIYKKSDLARKKQFATRYQDYKTNSNWNVKEQQIQSDTFHSDSSAFYLTEQLEYALTYKDSIGSVLPDNYSYFTVSAQLKTKQVINLKLVVTVTRNDSTLFWRGIDTESFTNKNEWNQILYVFQKPKGILPSDRLTVFFWNPFHYNAYIDDFEIATFADSDYNYYEF